MNRRIGIFTYGVVSYAIFFASFLYAVGFVGGFVVPRTVDGPLEGSLAAALAIDLGLLALFAVQHSVMARPAFKRWLTRFVPEPAERSTYVLASSVALLLLFWQWRPIGGVVWHLENPVAQAVAYTIFAVGWATVLTCTFLINHFDLFGLRQVWLALRGEPYTPLQFGTPGPYKVVRHPLYVGWLLAFWATPTMTATHLLFAVMTTAYILIAIKLEERDLIAAHGEYAEYRRNVGMLFPALRALDASRLPPATTPDIPLPDQSLLQSGRTASASSLDADAVARPRYKGRVTLVSDLQTPALVIDAATLDANLRTMAAALPGARLRPHVKAHKCTALARRQAALGHRTFTCATIREVEGLVAAGLGDDVLLANEVLDARRLGKLVARGIDARVTVAVDSDATIDAAAKGGVRDVLIDLNVGLPRCGCDPADAARLADLARNRGLTVRGVMGYEGHAMLLPDRAARASLVAAASEQLAAAQAAVGGDVVSTGGTGTYDLHTVATEIQAGSYALMDTAYTKLGLPFGEALAIVGTVVSTSTAGYAVADVGLKALGMDHGNSTIDGAQVWFFSDEHVTFAPERPVRVGDRVRVRPAHVDPTMAYHERAYVVEGERVVDTWLIDLRGW